MGPELSSVAGDAGLLNKIARLTEQRDLDMLEKSMLLTVREILQPTAAYLFRLRPSHGPSLAWHCLQDGQCLSGGAADLPNHRDLLTQPDSTDFNIPGTAGELGHVVVRRSTPVTTEERLVIEGLLRIYRNFLGVLEESQKDRLTSLFNRRTFESRFQNLLDGMVDVNTHASPSNRRSLASDDEVWLAMVDIDHFKRVNDTYGHLYGDEVLILVARLMRATFRDHDLLFRFGGEEFAVLLQAPDKKAALAGFERFRRAVAGYDFPQVGQVTVSVGVASVRETEPVPAVLIGKADSALYYAKEQGRNRVIFEGDMPAGRRGVKPPSSHDVELFG